MSETLKALTLARMDATRAAVASHVRRTPTLGLPLALAPHVAGLWGKFELWQVTGTFKARGAMANMLAMDGSALGRGVTAVSAGNHAIATAFAASRLGIDAKVVMTASAPPVRVARCEAYGATVIQAPDVHAAFEAMEDIVAAEGRAVIHPFEGVTTALGTAGVGRELCEDAPPLDAVIVPVGGGGLAAGIAAAVKLGMPGCAVFGVEPHGADSMSRSLRCGSPQSLPEVSTIADSLGAPMALPVSFELCAHYLDGVVTVSDAALVEAMRQQHRHLGLAVEPACAAALAALSGPLRTRLEGRKVGLVFCGSNIDASGWSRLVANDDAL